MRDVSMQTREASDLTSLSELKGQNRSDRGWNANEVAVVSADKTGACACPPVIGSTPDSN